MKRVDKGLDSRELNPYTLGCAGDRYYSLPDLIHSP